MKNTLAHRATSFRIYSCRKLGVKQRPLSCFNSALLWGLSSRSTSGAPSENIVFDEGSRVWRAYSRQGLCLRRVYLSSYRARQTQIQQQEIIPCNNNLPPRGGCIRAINFFLMIIVFWAKKVEVNINTRKGVLETSKKMCVESVNKLKSPLSLWFWTIGLKGLFLLWTRESVEAPVGKYPTTKKKSKLSYCISFLLKKIIYCDTEIKC